MVNGHGKVTVTIHQVTRLRVSRFCQKKHNREAVLYTTCRYQLVSVPVIKTLNDDIIFY